MYQFQSFLNYTLIHCCRLSITFEKGCSLYSGWIWISDVLFPWVFKVELCLPPEIVSFVSLSLSPTPRVYFPQLLFTILIYLHCEPFTVLPVAPALCRVNMTSLWGRLFWGRRQGQKLWKTPSGECNFYTFQDKRPLYYWDISP